MSATRRTKARTPPPERDDEDEARQLPRNLEAERAVLGAILTHNDAFTQATGIIAAADFYRLAHRLIYSSIERLLDRPQGSVDLVTVKNDLSTRGELEEVGTPYLSALVDGVPRSTNTGHYARIVRDKSRLRALVQTANTILTAAFAAEESAETIIAAADRAIMGLQYGHDPGETRALIGGSARLLERLEYNHAHRGELRGVDTGFASINEQTQGWMANDLVILAARPSIGKAQPLHAKILTYNGTWARMGDVCLGQELASPDGRPSFVTGIFPQGRKPMYRLTFVDGRSVEACGEHLWATYTSRRVGRNAVRSTQEIAALLQTPRYKSRLSVPLQTGTFGQSRDWPVRPWLLGVLLGDGTLRGTTPRVSTADAEIVERVKAELPPGMRVVPAGRVDYRLSYSRRGHKTPNPLRAALVDIGAWDLLAHEKRIPQIYMEGAYDDRRELLQGLMDSDGWAQGAVCFTTTSSGLALDVQALAHSLGAVCAVTVGQKNYKYKGQLKAGRQAYQLVISHHDPASLFTLKRKQHRAHVNKRRQRLTIASVELIGEMEAQCIRVSHPDGLYVTDGYVVTHNTAFILNTATAAAKTGRHVALFSLEMKREQLDLRLLSALSGVPATTIQQGYMTEAQWGPLTHAIGEMDELPIHINDTPALSVRDVRATCRRLKAEDRLDLVIIDYVQLMAGELDRRRQATRSEEVGHISRSLKILAGELSVPLLALSQLSRAGDQRTDTRPQLSDLRESGALEQDADLVCFLHRKNHREGGLTNFILGKQRNGPTGTVNLLFDRDIQRFADAGEEPAPTPAEVQAEDEHRKVRAIIQQRARKRA